MSSHREAPAISKDPNADNTDVYAFVDYNDPSKVNLIANFIPFQLPYGGPNFNEFSDDVVYAINISNDGSAQRNICYLFTFHTAVRSGNVFLYNTGPITSATDSTWNRPQTYTIRKVVRNDSGKILSDDQIAGGLTVPPCNVGQRSTPNYDQTFLSANTHKISGGRTVFAGQRSDPFWVDLGSIFDLGGLRPLNEDHEIPLMTQYGVNGLSGYNVHTIALQVPITEVQRYGHMPDNPGSSNSVIGVWASTHRMRNRTYDTNTGKVTYSGAYAQMSRLANPLFNELLNGMGEKDTWNAQPPWEDKNYASNVTKPLLGTLLPTLYTKSGQDPSTGAFPNLYKFNQSGMPRADLEAILLTGIPYGVVKDSSGKPYRFTTYSGNKPGTSKPVLADMLRLNLAIPATDPSKASELGVLGGDLAGFPNGRRPADNVTRIELLAIAGLTIPLVDPSYKPDTVVTNEAGNKPSGEGSNSYFDGTYYNNLPLTNNFPYIGEPSNGYDGMPGTASATLPSGMGTQS